MQAFDPRGVYSDAAVIAALRGTTGNRYLEFRYDRLGSDLSYRGPLTNIEAGHRSYDSLADVKGTAKFTLIDDGSIDFLKDRIKPYVRLRMPDGGFVEWPQGVYILAAPTRTLKTEGWVERQVDAYDQLFLLSNDFTTARTTVTAGMKYTDAILSLTTDLPARSVTASTKTLPAAMEWDPGTARLTILNDLLAAINYRSVSFDENGTMVCVPYVLPDTVTPPYTYATDSTSVIAGDIDDTLDVYSVPNRWVLIVSNPESTALVSTVTNTSASSPTSTVSRGRTITSVLTGQDAADQATLDAKAARVAFEGSQVFEEIDFQTALMPMHGDSDVLGIVINGLGLTSAKFSEFSFEYDLKVGAMMSHKIRRTVSVA